MRASLSFTAFGRATPAYDSSSDVLLGANLGCAQLVGMIERAVTFERAGSSRAETAVAGSARFTILAYVPQLEALEGETFCSVKEARDAVRAELVLQGCSLVSK